MSFKQFPTPKGDVRDWGSALVGELEKIDFGVPIGVVCVVFGKVPQGWAEYTASGMPTLPSGGKWIRKR